MAIFKEINLFDQKIENEEKKLENLWNSLKGNLNDNLVVLDDLIFKKNLPVHFIEKKNLRPIALLIMHLKSILSIDCSSAMNPFKRILNHPDKFVKSYLPSLPHDEELKIYQNLGQIINENIKFFQCPNGHFYTIADCNKAVSESVCPTCKTKIGGLNYKLAEGNKEAEGKKIHEIH